MIEHKELHEFASWRDEWTYADAENALVYAGLVGWTFDHWSDGDMQFMHKGPVSFDDLAKLRITFTPRRMNIEAVIDSDLHDDQLAEWKRAGCDPRQQPPVPLIVLVTMSWNAVSDPEAI